jgi:hypothetical protein
VAGKVQFDDGRFLWEIKGDRRCQPKHTGVVRLLAVENHRMRSTPGQSINPLPEEAAFLFLNAHAEEEPG